jgi:hypothetical protein
MKMYSKLIELGHDFVVGCRKLAFEPADCHTKRGDFLTDVIVQKQRDATALRLLRCNQTAGERAYLLIAL